MPANEEKLVSAFSPLFFRLVRAEFELIEMLELIFVLAEKKTERNDKNVNLINQIKTRIMLSLNSDSFLSAYSSEL